ncbi:MAG TPA: hypothetical protein VHA07_03155 [Devosia sp.]|nr:hypothetical protein [Devosia sp.]
MTPQRAGAIAGALALAAGGVGGALERGWPSSDDAAAVAAFVRDNGPAVLGQSAGFVLSAAFYILFLSALRARLKSTEGDGAWLSAAMFGAGLVWVTLSILAQALQTGVATAALHGVEPPQALLWTLVSVFGVANLPAALMLTAVGVAIVRGRAFPLWLGWIALAAALAQAVLTAGAFVPSGPLSATGWATYALYPVFLVWLLPTIVLMWSSRSADAPGAR